MNKIGFISLGCAKNLTDSETMLSLLKSNGYEIVDNHNFAEIMIVNTCCFIDSAKQESIDTILDVADLKKDAKLKLLIVAGCLGERFKEEILNELPEVDAVCGTGDFANICEIIEQAKEKRGVFIGGCDNAPLESGGRLLLTPFYTAYLKIAEGCDNHCTYCVIPSIRGKYRSRKMENILEEAAALVRNGAKELVVIAQDVSCYGKDIYGYSNLQTLISKLSEIEGLEWLRLHYLYPEEITDDLIETIASSSKILPYFDIPIQHISNSILKAMGRHTNAQSIKKLILKIRSRIPQAVIRTSLIVGFPGETEDDFNELLCFIKEFHLEHVGVFTFSCEDGTPAARLPMQIDEDVKISRQERAMEMQYEIVQQNNMKRIGKVETVLVEGYDKVVKLYYGRTYRDSIDVDSKVFISSHKTLDTGGFYDVKLTDVLDYDMLAEFPEEGRCNE